MRTLLLLENDDVAPGELASQLEALGYAIYQPRTLLEARRQKPTEFSVVVTDLRVAGGKSTAIFEGHISDVHGVAYGPSDASIITAGDDGTVRVWPVDPMPPALERRPRRALAEWELARERRQAEAARLEYR